MEQTRRFSLLTFPQFFDGETLTVNMVVLPRDQNPLSPALNQADTAAFADAALSFEARIVSSLAAFPNNHSADAIIPLTTSPPDNTRALFTSLAEHFNITNLNQVNTDPLVHNSGDKAETAISGDFPIKKYLPMSYRNQFNFTTPRTRAAVTDDSYHCAVRSAGQVAGFQRSPEEISWGKVFAYALRQPLLARELKMIYTTSFTIDLAHFPDGGWLYIALGDGSDYLAAQQADPEFIRYYAARIPALTLGTARPLFAPLLFPVLFKTNPGDPDPAPDGNFDALFIEAAAYDDGFGKIVHATQSRSRLLLEEENISGHPVKETGIRFGWDDEQILIWYLRQLAADSSVANASKRLDAPLGVFGFALDVRETANPVNPWESLVEVSSLTSLNLPDADNRPIDLGAFAGELPYQVYPAQLDGDKNGTYWLPMYFGKWQGGSIVLPDSDAAHVYQNNAEDVQADGLTGVTGPAQNQLNQRYAPAGLNITLRYGRQYDFRVRMRDLSGGGANLSATPTLESPSSIGQCAFKRYVAPNQVLLEDLPNNTDELSHPDHLMLHRPLLGYPTVVYTGKYDDPVTRLREASLAMAGVEAFGIPDPDVNRIEITVEVETLKLDNLLSVSGKDNYIHLYTTVRSFPDIVNDDDYGSALHIPIIYQDLNVLHTGAETNIEADFALSDDIDALAEIVLPTARAVRLTLRAVCEEKDDNEAYYGALDEANHNRDSRYGPILEVRVYQESHDERDLFIDSAEAQRLQGIFLQPDAPNIADGRISTLFFGKSVQRPPDMVQRLAKQLDLENMGLTLVGEKGERIQFGCSSRIRHTLAPDNSSLTFSSKGDLSNHWLCVVQLTIDRDWTWNALADRAFVIERTLRFTQDDPETETEVSIVGDIEVRAIASFEILQNSKRNYTRLVFIDAVEPKTERMQDAPNQNETRFPDTIEVTYRVTSHFKAGHAADTDPPETIDITLPITTSPSQIPTIKSAGIALSPYQRNQKYSATEPRQRFLWVEFEEAVRDPNDTYFARMLAYAPDQLISNNNPELLIAPQEPSLPLPSEEIRTIIPGGTNTLAGLNAMQQMSKATDSDHHYILPLPPGLHAESDEMFGFFTYEFRLGHLRNKETEEMVWSTAQGRFGRRLRATGIQQPAPTLTCATNRDEKKLWVVAPYAAAVFNGKDVTADPPRTELWCLLYAQVRQADNLDFRNILLDDKQLDWRVQVEPEPEVERFARYDDLQLRTLKNVTIKNFKDEISYAKLSQVYKLVDFDKKNKDGKKYGTAVWANEEISQWLKRFGLPEKSSLSVVVVEVLPQITNIFDHVSALHKKDINAKVSTISNAKKMPSTNVAAEQTRIRQHEKDLRQNRSPLSDELGKHRILRTSPLTEVPFVCCPTS